jgi:hypothetical protein
VTEFHELANVFSLIEGPDFDGLVDSIRANGQREPITYFEGKILDGRNRYRACVEVDVKPVGRDFEGSFEQARQFVIDANMHRRHLTTSQRAAAAAELATMKQGARTDLPSKEGKSQAEAAKQMKVSVASVERAAIVKKADPALFEQVKKGNVSVTAAAKTAGPPKIRTAPLGPTPAPKPERIREAVAVESETEQRDRYTDNVAKWITDRFDFFDLDRRERQADNMIGWLNDVCPGLAGKIREIEDGWREWFDELEESNGEDVDRYWPDLSPRARQEHVLAFDFADNVPHDARTVLDEFGVDSNESMGPWYRVARTKSKEKLLQALVEASNDPGLKGYVKVSKRIVEEAKCIGLIDKRGKWIGRPEPAEVDSPVVESPVVEQPADTQTESEPSAIEQKMAAGEKEIVAEELAAGGTMSQRDSLAAAPAPATRGKRGKHGAPVTYTAEQRAQFAAERGLIAA